MSQEQDQASVEIIVIGSRSEVRQALGQLERLMRVSDMNVHRGRKGDYIGRAKITLET